MKFFFRFQPVELGSKVTELVSCNLRLTLLYRFGVIRKRYSTSTQFFRSKMTAFEDSESSIRNSVREKEV